jgi:tRNA modification GTPase
MKGNQEDIDRNIVINAEHLRNATKFLGKITGQITNEQILDVIFKDFCIGK